MGLGTETEQGAGAAGRDVTALGLSQSSALEKWNQVLLPPQGNTTLLWGDPEGSRKDQLPRFLEF